MVRLLARVCSVLSQRGPRIWAFPSSSAIWTCTTATSGVSGLSASHSSPENGSLSMATSALDRSSIWRIRSEPRSERIGMKGSPSAPAR